jgi:two-component system phosphate regulon response regulator PhoB
MAKRILVVEDEVAVQDVLCSILELAQCEVEVAENGSVALEKLTQAVAKATTPHLIFLDLLMPHMDGTTFVHELRRLHLCPDIPIIVISGDARVREQVRNLDMDIFIGKPFGIHEVLDVVNALVPKASRI